MKKSKEIPQKVAKEPVAEKKSHKPSKETCKNRKGKKSTELKPVYTKAELDYLDEMNYGTPDETFP